MLFFIVYIRKMTIQRKLLLVWGSLRLAPTKVPTHSHLSAKQPRFIKQIKNIWSQILEKKRLSHDGLYNLHELAIDLTEFIHSIQTHPDLVCVCGDRP